ncbi:hypothetical protein COT78_02280 [Candidatus Berkelbacteria bacterium CG10_big_fil_rev_8_21_14_0_10_43_13]|uniref:Glycosyl transferase family 28 C-terminal domain-containing protein n=1 Tax=Candidatus Berkelbacteria bacterium CG10_big_fil_rev_8_21_14_0_10_43_13 TaxID=1974514 RepID=A0A2H0W6H8_9BACT|nr:MAG: hypothetical protein COT78_02280 [Candidatus Berkelbacteria bacterium CG10_big_fil_rev_8_21_14_0_10_43_13]
MRKTYKSTVLYYAGWNSFTHIGGAYNLAKAMPDVFFHVTTAEKWPFPKLENLQYHKLYRPNCAVRFEEKIFLHTYTYERELGDIKKYRRHLFEYLQLLNKINPNMVISDITMEIALWSKFFGYPTCTFYETVDTHNLRHKIVWDNADSILVRYPKQFVEEIETNIHPKMFFCGGVSKFDLDENLPSKAEAITKIGADSNKKTVTFLASSQSQIIPSSRKYFNFVCAGLNKVSEENNCFVLYPKKDSIVQKLQKKYSKIHFVIGIFNQVQYYLSAADVVVSGSGMGATMETCFFRVPMLQIPVPWVFKEQMIKASALERIGAARVISPVKMSAESIAGEISTLLNDTQVRKETREAQAKMIDRKGYQRLARHIQKMLNSSLCKDKISITSD